MDTEENFKIAKKQSDFLVLKQKIILTDSLIKSYNFYRNKDKKREEELLNYKSQITLINDRYETLLQEHTSLKNVFACNDDKFKLLEKKYKSIETKEKMANLHIARLTENIEKLQLKVNEAERNLIDTKTKYEMETDAISTKHRNLSDKINIDMDNSSIAELYKFILLFGKKAQEAKALSKHEINKLKTIEKKVEQLKSLKKNSNVEDTSSIPLFNESQEELEMEIYPEPMSCISTDSGLSSYSPDDLKSDNSEINVKCTPFWFEQNKMINTNEVYSNDTFKSIKYRNTERVNRATSPITIKTNSSSTSPLPMNKNKTVDFSASVTEDLLKKEFDILDNDVTDILNKIREPLPALISPISFCDVFDTDTNMICKTIRKHPTRKLIAHQSRLKKLLLTNKRRYLKCISVIKNEMNIYKKAMNRRLTTLEDELIKIKDTKHVQQHISNDLKDKFDIDRKDKCTSSQFNAPKIDDHEIDESTENICVNIKRKSRLNMNKALFGDDDDDDDDNACDINGVRVNRHTKRKLSLSINELNPDNKKHKISDEISRHACVEQNRKIKIDTEFESTKNSKFKHHACNILDSIKLTDNYKTLNSPDKIEKAKSVIDKLDKTVKNDGSKTFLRRSNRIVNICENAKNPSLAKICNKPLLLNSDTKNKNIEMEPKTDILSKEKAVTIGDNINEKHTFTDTEKQNEIVYIKIPEKNNTDELNRNRKIISYSDINESNIQNEISILRSIVLEYLESKEKRTSNKLTCLDIFVDTSENILNVLEEQLPKINIDAPSLQNVVETLTKYKTKCIVHAIVLYISKNNKDNGNPVLLPGMPPVISYCHQTVLCLLKILDKNMGNILKKSNIFHLVMNEIKYKIFQLKQSQCVNENIRSLSTFYAILCLIFNQKDELKIFCMDALYCLSFKSICIIHSVLQVWPQLFPKITYKQAQDPFAIVMMHLMITISDKDEFKEDHLKKFIIKHYGYHGGEYNDSSVLELLANAITDIGKKSSKKSIEAAFIIFGKRCGPEWCYKNIIINTLIPIMDNTSLCDESRAFAARIIGPLMKPFPKTMLIYRDVISRKLLDVLKYKVSQMIEEEAIYSLSCFPCENYDTIAKGIVEWKPTTKISQDTVDILQKIVRCKPKQFWRKLII